MNNRTGIHSDPPVKEISKSSDFNALLKGHIQDDERNVYVNKESGLIHFQKIQLSFPYSFSSDLPYAIIFYKCGFDDKISFNGDYSNGFTFQECSFNSKLIIDCNTIDAHLFFSGCRVLDSMIIFNGSINGLTYSGGFIEDLRIFGGQFSEFTINSIASPSPCRINTLNIKDLYGLSFPFLLKSSILGEFTLEGGYSNNYSINLNDASCQRFIIQDFVNISGLRIKGLTTDELTDHEQEFKIENSDLGQAKFFQTNLASYQSVKIHNSQISEVAFNAVDWPSIISAELDPNQTQNKQRKEVYRQIKTAYQKQGDTINAKKLYEKEMDTYLGIKPFPGNRQEKWILRLSKWTSNYGQSLVKPAQWLGGSALIIGVLMMALNLIVSPQNPEFPLIGDKYAMGKAVKLFLMLSNPLHDIPSNTNFGIYGLDLLSRVIASYMIYNFIRASRRFV